MNKPTVFRNKRRPATPQEQALASVFHPLWFPLADYQLLKLRAKGKNFHEIAELLGRPRIAVEQRFHRLRVIPNIVEKLEAYGLTDALYPTDRGDGKTARTAPSKGAPHHG